ncbi:NLP/P60 protein [Catenulispora acidiphila DSM 44928]|uniref:NLP/P60 protein n=1 Tax=Catenulispora acidiphila (strain DSM 44928 / JCM 14897 / NBRC 102108 / NRRL B-24433 / ID139908) TaxID=479433 RepID=C7Q1R0_CATAD|nr:NlpC/P60 family protein [Catenulispora acidiphila]ACU75611.1 NLP/P60 protein [Catenulispora acidiphila DSM 44928]
MVTSPKEAAHRAPKKYVPVSRTAMTVTLATAAAGSVALLPTAEADPNANINDVKAQVDKLHQEAEQASEAYNEANTSLSDLQHKVDQLQSRITAEQGSLDSARGALGGLAAAQYESGGIDSALQLMLTQSPDQYLQQATSLAQVTDSKKATMSSAAEIQRQLNQDKASASDELAMLAKTRTVMGQQKADIDAKEKQAKDLLNQLTATQRAQYNRMVSNSNSGVSKSTISNLPVPTDARAAIAVAFAKAQVGKPYIWAAAGPNAYDCSGLTMAAWGKAGVAMAHGSRDQYAAFPKVSKSQLQPGDLVLFYSDMHHIGIYVGDGMVIHAGNPASGVQYIPMNEMPAVGFVRP